MRHPALCLEILSIFGLAKTKLAKSMLDAASNQALQQWKYKSLWNETHARPFLSLDAIVFSSRIAKPKPYRSLSLSDREIARNVKPNTAEIGMLLRT